MRSSVTSSRTATPKTHLRWRRRGSLDGGCSTSSPGSPSAGARSRTPPRSPRSAGPARGPHLMLRWGILGDGGPAAAVAPAMRAAGADLAVVASASLSRAQAFAAEQGVRRARTTYDEVLDA